jgi:hypothetical protein
LMKFRMLTLTPAPTHVICTSTVGCSLRWLTG